MPAVTGSSRGRRGRRAVAEMNMVPFIDVMLVLLIIFMVSAPLVAPSLVNLPSAGQARNMPGHVAEVILKANGDLALRVDGRKATAYGTLPELMDAVRDLQANDTEDKSTPVVISADKSVRYEQVMDIMRQLHQGQIQRIGLAVQPGR
ncbi:biopolymer transporter ExbD [Amphibiibacter pelophylacis]|uniref:Biopolymer transporter ExbD n=1 Tax=Amphibiibacter pelophylacis TaxID=1799477 RepID=A0ACC6P4K9_9BURK